MWIQLEPALVRRLGRAAEWMRLTCRGRLNETKRGRMEVSQVEGEGSQIRLTHQIFNPPSASII
jgi:hypothetical protein